MSNLFGKLAVAALATAFAGEALATEWNVSVWGKRRAFTEHVEKLAELVSEKTGGEFTMNVSYGGLSKNRENLDGISIGPPRSAGRNGSVERQASDDEPHAAVQYRGHRRSSYHA